MNHKDLLDSVIAGMAAKEEAVEETKSIDADAALETNDNCIKISLAVGAEFKLDATTFDWTGAVAHIPQMMANENEFVKLQTGLINAATDDSDMAKAFIADSIKQLSAYLESYDVHIDYRTVCAGLTDHQLAQVLLFDANNITKTLLHHITMYDAIRFISASSGPTMMGVDLASNPDESAETGVKVGGGLAEDDAIYLVEASAGEGGLTIDNIVATTDYPVDAVDVVNDSGNGGYTVYVSANDVTDARDKAIELLGMRPTTYEYDDDAISSGLLEDESIYSALHDETTEEVAE
jgi:hypothetical protein